MASNRLDLDLMASIPDPWAALSVELGRVQEDRGRVSRQVAVRAMSFRKWAGLVPESRGPLDFGRFAYQRELYQGWMASDREACFLKAAQTGISTLAIRFALYHADVHGHVCLYTFPTDGELQDFSRQRIRPVIRASPHLLERIPARAVDNAGLRQVGATGWLYCRGTQRPIDSIDADVVVFDELDYSDQANIEASERRVTGPMSAGLLRRVGVPTVPGFGISAAYEASDQRVWTVRCGACGEHNPMRGAEAFAANVDQEQLAIVCRKCRRRLDVQGAGEWVPTFPGRDVRGYHLPKLIVPGVRLDELVANSRKTRPDQVEAFHNRDLGEPYAAAEHRLSIEQIRACVVDDLRLPASIGQFSDKLVCLGCDVASVRALNVVVEEILDSDGRGRRLFVGEIEDSPDGTALEHLCALMRRFNVSMACIDRAPERRLSEAFAARFPGVVYLVGYKTPAPSSNATVWDVDDAGRMVTLWRTLGLDAALERFRTRAIELPPLEMLPADYPAHLGALVRQNVEMAGGQVRPEYRAIGPDDYAQAEVYCLAAVELLWRRIGLAKVLGAGPVLLEAGDDGGDDDDPLGFGEPVYRPPFS
jgi:hypothetical protein